MRKTVITLGVMVLVILGLSIFAHDMSFFNKVISSEIRGVVLDGGKSAGAGMKVVREVYWTWGNETITDEATTDGVGRFYLPEITRFTFFGSILPHEPVIKQSVYIIKNEEKIKAYLSYKRDYTRNSEFDGIADGNPAQMKFHFSCDIAQEPIQHSIEKQSTSYLGICNISMDKTIF